MRQGNFRHKIWPVATEDANVESGVPCTLRHTATTWILSSDECSLAAVFRWLGHEDKVTTLRLYDHVIVGKLEQLDSWWMNRQ